MEDNSLQPVFRMVGVSKVYHMGEIDVVALSRVSLTLFSHEMVVLLGASGSGKSTLPVCVNDFGTDFIGNLN